jgi:hypothetical protein
MRHRDDDLSPFREDPVVKALTGPGSEAELAEEADALAAYRAAVPAAPKRRRSAARVATGGTVAALTIAVTGGVAAAYTGNLPDSWQRTVHDKVPSSWGVPDAPEKAPVAQSPQPQSTPSLAPPAPTPTPTPTPTPSSTAASPKPTKTRATEAPSTPTPIPTGTLPVEIPTTSPTPTKADTPTPTPTPTPSATDKPQSSVGGRLHIGVAPGHRVTVGTQLTVHGKLTSRDGSPAANRRVELIARAVGDTRHRIGVGRTDASGQVTISGPTAQRNMHLVLRAGRHVHSQVQRVVVVPIIHVQVPPTARGATSAVVTMSVTGGQPGDTVVIRNAAGGSKQVTLNGSSAASFTVPVSPSQTLHYRVVVLRTSAHAEHSLPFYVPPSGG